MKFTLLLLLILNSFLLNAKTSDFSLIVHKTFNAALVDITQNYDGTLSVLGFTNDFKKPLHVSKSYSDPFEYLQSLSSKYGAKMALIRINDKAKIIDSKVINITKFAKPASFIKTPSNGYFIGGYTMDGEQLVLMLDANLQLTHYNYFGTKNHNKMNKLIPLKDGGVLAVGTSFTSRMDNDNIFKSGLGKDDICISRFTKNAQLLWSKKYGTKDDDEGIDAIEADDGSIIVLSATHTASKTNVVLSRLTQNGDTIWLKKILSKESVTPTSLHTLRDKDFLVLVSESDAMGKKQIHLLKYDIHHNLLIDSMLQTRYSSQLNDIQEFSNGNLIGVGFVEDGTNTDGLAMLLNNKLKLLKQEHYGDENYDIFNKAAILSNLQIGIAGIHTANNSNENNMWVIKLNDDLSLAQIPQQSQDIYEQLIKLFSKEIQQKKLLIKKDLTIEFIDKNLCFKAGAYKLSKAQKQFFTQFSNKLIPFLYAHKIQVESLEVNGHTSSEWKNTDFSHNYLNNEELSMKRSFETIRSLFISQDLSKQKYLTKILKGSGLSYRKRVMHNNHEDKKRSRRVSLKIILKH